MKFIHNTVTITSDSRKERTFSTRPNKSSDSESEIICIRNDKFPLEKHSEGNDDSGCIECSLGNCGLRIDVEDELGGHIRPFTVSFFRYNYSVRF